MLQFNNHVFKEILKNFQKNVFGKIFEIPILELTLEFYNLGLFAHPR
jgi:hypothetical protein